MELTYNELKKRDVINVVDGQCLGRISDLRINFPSGKLTGIYVPGRKVNFFIKLFTKSSVFIDESNIIKIGGDVILVDLKCGNFCSENSRVNGVEPIAVNENVVSVKPYPLAQPPPKPSPCPPCPPPCPPKRNNPCPPPCPPHKHSPCPPPCPPHGGNGNCIEQEFSIFSGACGRIDTEDY